MSDPITMRGAIAGREPTGVWTGRLVLFLRVMAGLSMLKGLYHWAAVLGVGEDPSGFGFEANLTSWQAATIFFAVIDLVAAVGLWLAAAWGGVVWLTASISMAAIEAFFPQIFGGRIWMMAIELAGILAYVGIALMAAYERPP
jgi:hypothetical protein